jgi:acyl-homoserine lactone acylase PvdQ
MHALAALLALGLMAGAACSSAEGSGSGVSGTLGVGGCSDCPSGGAGGAGGAGNGGNGGASQAADVPDFLNIVPPGQDGSLNAVETAAAQGGTYPPHVIDQLAMYHDLVKASPSLTEGQLIDFYKDASLGVAADQVEREYSPIAGAVVRRDKQFGVPHITGETRYATMFAQGYTGAEDRLFLMDALRHIGRARMSEFLGASEANQARDRDQLAIAPYKEEDLTAQVKALGESGAEGAAVVEDLKAYADGVNAYIAEALLDVTKLPAEYGALQQLPAQWKPEDSVAIASLIGGALGKGGGAELVNHCGLKKLKAALGSASEARAVFDDLHFAEDPEAPTTSQKPAPYLNKPASVDAAAHPDVDCDTLEPIEGGFLPLPLRSGGPLGDAMSNALLVSAAHTKTGRPIAVFGPQTGYFMPEILVEKDVKGPGIEARGAAFAGTDMWVELGRGKDFAWSATSSGADNIDQWVLKLCEPGLLPATVKSMGYMHNGACQPIETYQHFQIAKPSAGGLPDPLDPDIILSWRVERTPHYGPLVARGKLEDGTPIAIASRRSTYGRELTSAIGFYRLNNPEYMAGGVESFRTAVSAIEYTFNWFYIDKSDIAYQHACLCPERSPSVDPYLPVWGTGQWDWSGFIPLEAQPFDKNPEQGYIVSWNNKQAPGFSANDANFGYGPVYRSDMIERRIALALSSGKIDRAHAVVAVEEAATVDLRGQEVLSFALAVMGPNAPAGIDARAIDMRARIEAWLKADAHRRDHDGDGLYDDPQPLAIADAWWPRLCHAVFDASSGDAISAFGLEVDDHQRLAHTGSAFQTGLYSHVQKDLRQILGEPVKGAWSRTYCGGGDLNACRSALWSSMAAAAADLEAELKDPDVADWKRDITYEDVRYTAVGVTSVPPQPWTNRPTFQQVVQINGAEAHYKTSY